ncbi:RdRP-domain-containing protein [Trametes sanguinea]|nr:RdRP-domain-containing protein [Trametes sanguinea]
MEVFMMNIVPGTPLHRIKMELATVLHAPPFRQPTQPLVNFEIYIFPRRQRSRYQCGVLTLPTSDIGELFLQLYGGNAPQRSVQLGSIRVHFQPSRNAPRRDVLERIRRMPFEDPRVAQARELEAATLQERTVAIVTIQFGWECRDHVYSIEWEKACSAVLTLVAERREFRISVRGFGLDPRRIIAIRAPQIAWVSSAVHEESGVPVIFFSLSNPPSFESASPHNEFLAALGQQQSQRRRWSAFDESHLPFAPYTSLAIRLECSSQEDLRTFRDIARSAHVHPEKFSYHVERRDLFAQSLREEYNFWIVRQPMIVGFQVEALLRSWLLDFTEVLRLRRPIENVLRSRGRDFTASLLQDYMAQAKALYWYGEDNYRGNDDSAAQLPSNEPMDPVRLFDHVQTRFVYKPLNTALSTAEATAPFYCLHVNVTPTTMILEGPYPERSNRIMRKYHTSQDSFLRVSFQDENRLQLRFDREVDGRDFIARRVKPILLEGLTIAGAHFDFLAYSQSALKEHAVWFVKPFRHRNELGYTTVVDAAAIIRDIGTFRNLSFDRDLMRCPARYAARISQAFTATDASISVDVGQIMAGGDIKDPSGMYAFTDGVGTISPDLAKEIWRALQERRRRGRRDRTYPRAYQIRFQGSKGMLSVDYTLSGRAILLRPSMVKFEAPHSLTVEIARAFDKPGMYYLNRPLIMLLDGLGVPHEVFLTLQDNAVQDVQGSVESLERSARLLEGHGLGASFRLTSAMLGLHKLGVGPLDGDLFWEQMMDFAVNHVLRELKHHARIPVPDSWTLVGVADVHGYLQEGQIFACIDAPDSNRLIYLEGRALISRSPTIHPGDVQVVNAIGRPPPGSPFARESLRNTVVFSIKGARPLPSCLGGGDLDGDVYNVTTMPELLPPRTYPAASYQPANRKLVDHESTIADVAEFVAEYITSDTLGIIGTTWLTIADQSDEHIFDPDCLKLAALHSDAVDYPKSGQPVPIESIPRLHLRTKPDWSAPETSTEESPNFYESTRAIGKLYRAIDLPALRTVNSVRRFQRRHLGADSESTAAEFFARFQSADDRQASEIFIVVQERVEEFIDPAAYDQAAVTANWELYRTYVSRLRAICADHTLSNSRTAMLTEEEAVIGTIVAKCSQPRKRKDLMAKMREQTTMLVGDVRSELAGDDDVPPERSLRSAWIAFQVAETEHEQFGARSFMWVALSSIFDAIKEIEEDERTQGLGHG